MDKPRQVVSLCSEAKLVAIKTIRGYAVTGYRFWIMAAIAVVLFALLSNDSVERATSIAANRMIGGYAQERLRTQAAANNTGHVAAADMISLPIKLNRVTDSVSYASGVANSIVITTSDGFVVFDAGLIIQAAEQMDVLRQVTGAGDPAAVVLSHSHADHVGATRFWLGQDTELIAHTNFVAERDYLTALDPYLHQRNRVLFPWLPEKPRTLPGMNFRGLEPTVTVSTGSRYAFQVGDTPFEVLGTPGAEGRDNVVLWLPEDKVLISGDFFGPQFPQFPNIFTMRGEKVRDPVAYINSLDQLLALSPQILIPSHLTPITDPALIKQGMRRIRDAVDYVHRETLTGMNAGKSVHTLMAEIQLPEHLSLSQTHGKVSWAVKSIWEYYATWFHYDRTSELYATPQSAVLPELQELVALESLLAVIDGYIASQQWEHALLLLELWEPQSLIDPELNTRYRKVLNALAQRNQQEADNGYERFWLESRIARLKSHTRNSDH